VRHNPVASPGRRAQLAAALLAAAALAGASVPAVSVTGAVDLPGAQILSKPMTSSRELRLAMDDGGNATAMYFYGDDIADGVASCKLNNGEETDYCTAAAQTWTTAGDVSPLVDLSARFSAFRGQGDIAVNSHGAGVAVWYGSSLWGGIAGLVVRARSSAGGWGPPEVLTSQGYWPAVGVDADGRAVVAWLNSVPRGPFGIHEGRVQALVRDAGGGLLPVQEVSPDVFSDAVQVAVNDAGDAVLVWRAQVDGENWTTQARAMAADGTLSPIQSLSAPGVNTMNPRVRIDADGDALVVWQLGFVGGVQARSRSAAGTLSPIQLLSPAGRHGREPQIAMRDDGTAVVAWTGAEPGNEVDRVQARARSAAGAWSGVETVSLHASLGIVDQPQVAMDQSGRALVTWSQEAGDSLYTPLQARTRSPQGAWSSVTHLSQAKASTWQARVAVSPTGRAVVLWEEFWSYTDHHDWGPAIVGRAFPLSVLPPDRTAPVTTIVSGPPATTRKRTVTFRFRSNEPGSTFQCRLDGAAWRTCSSPRSYRKLSYARHVFRVRAIDPSGNVDTTPALRAFRVVRN
jgi:hypothetical protein